MQECGQRPKPCCRSSPLYPTGIRKSICLQNNKTESQQNTTSVKQQNSVSTQQRNSKTVTSVSQYFSQSVLQSVSTSVSQCFSQSVLQSVLTSISQSAFLDKTPCGPSFFDWFCSRCRLRERVVRLFRLAGEQGGTGRDIRPVFGGQKHYMFCPRQAVFSVTRNRFRNRKQLARKGMENSSEVVVFYRAPHVPRPDFNRRRVSGTLRSKMGTMDGRHNCVQRAKEKEQTFKGCSDKWGYYVSILG